MRYYRHARWGFGTMWRRGSRVDRMLIPILVVMYTLWLPVMVIAPSFRQQVRAWDEFR